jgi:hypothetical protein
LKIPKTFSIDEKFLPLLRKKAKEQKRSVSFLVDEAISQYLNQGKKKKLIKRS